MKKRWMGLLLGLTLGLAACGQGGGETPPPTAEETVTATPEVELASGQVTELWGFPIDNTHDAFEVPTGGKRGTVLVTVEMNREELISTLSVWDASDLTTPIQTMREEGATTHRREIFDANFDGDMDFSYIWASGAKNNDFGLYIWDEEEGRFSPGRNFLGHLKVDEEGETVRIASNGAGTAGTVQIFQWIDGELSCVRRIERHYPETGGEKITQLLTVEEYGNGEWTEIERKICGEETLIYDEASLWYDLNYHGEEKETLWGFPINDTHDAFEVPTGGRRGTVLVTVELAENEEAVYGEELQFAVWTADNLEKPIQTMAAEWISSFRWRDVIDANFDGYMDFGYMYAMGNQPAYYHYWIWDEEQGLFVAEPEFDQISWPQFDEETGVISGYARGGFAGAAGTHTFHQWIDGKPVCIRKITTFPYGADTLNEIRLAVEEPVEGTLTEIYRHETDIGTAFEEVEKWRDLDYHGS